MYAVYSDRVHSPISPLQLLPDLLATLTPFLSSLLNLLSLIILAHMSTGVGPSTGEWSTSQGLYT